MRQLADPIDLGEDRKEQKDQHRIAAECRGWALAGRS
jgi:hypothetical protein